MMTPTRKSGRQPKPSAKLKEYLYDDVAEKPKGPAPKETAKKAVTKETLKRGSPKKEPVKRETGRKPSPQTTKTTGPRMVEKKSTPTSVNRARATPKRGASPIKNESPDTATPARKSGRTPKPSAKLQEYLYDDKSNDSQPSRKSSRDTEKTKRIKIKEEREDTDEMEESEEEEEEEETEVRRQAPIKKQANKPVKENVPSKRISNKMTTQELLRKQMLSKSSTLSHRARVTSLTSVAAKKERNASQLTVQSGKIYRSLSTVKDKQPPSKKVLQEKTQAKKVASISKEKVSLINKRKREPEVIPTANKKFIKTKDPSKLFERAKMASKETKENTHKVEKKEIEKVLQVNKEVMTQLLNFGAEVAEAMACNNESIFSFSTKDNPLQSFKIDKQQDDFSDEEVIKIIKWFEEEEEQRRTYRKRILEALRASHETNMSLYSQMLKMLQSVTTC